MFDVALDIMMTGVVDFQYYPPFKYFFIIREGSNPRNSHSNLYRVLLLICPINLSERVAILTHSISRRYQNYQYPLSAHTRLNS